MGKHRKLKLKNSPITRADQPVIDEKVRQERVLPLIAGLTDTTNIDHQAHSLFVLTALINDRNLRHMLLRERLIKTLLGKVLPNANINMLSQCLNVLRHIVSTEGRDPAVFLIREGIKNVVNSNAKKCSESLADFANLKHEDQSVLAELSEALCGLGAIIIANAFDAAGWQDVINLSVALIAFPSVNEVQLLQKSLDAAFELLYYVSEDLDEESVYSSFTLAGEKVPLIKSVAVQAATPATKLYGIGIEFNFLLTTDNELLDITGEICQYLRDTPRDDEDSVRLYLELLTIASQTDDLEQILLLSNEVGPLLVDFLQESKPFQQSAVSVLNNIGWSLSALRYEWVEDAKNIFPVVCDSMASNLANTEFVTSCLGLTGCVLLQAPQIAEQTPFISLLGRLLSQVEELLTAKNPQWCELSRALVVVLASSSKVAITLNLVSSTTQLIFTMLEHGDALAQIDALNGLFKVHGDNESSFNQKEYNDLCLNERLETLKPLLKRSLKSVPKTDEILRQQALGMLQTLEAFIKYKHEAKK